MPTYSVLPQAVDFAKVFARQAQADCLFDWAAKVAPASFAPQGAASLETTAGRLRYYAQTQTYLAIGNESGRVYYLSGAQGAAVSDLGDASSWLATAGCNAN